MAEIVETTAHEDGSVKVRTSRMDVVRAERAARDAERGELVQRLRSIGQRRFDDLVAVAFGPDEEARTAWAERRWRLAATLAYLVEPDGPDRDLDVALDRLLGLTRPPDEAPPYTASLDAARAFVAAALPGFWVSSGLCGLTGHASLGPDYNGRAGERLHREWPLDVEGAVETWDEDLAPGDGLHRECRAILACAVRALAYQHERAA
ncbi:hypothetical protein ACQKJ1_26340 [Methylorubrum rhodesianum]|uniref:hypothetical protein n=1 Tax=Methylorubrum rhodesianum TaxID=29427 RepID=UPI003CFC77D1